MDAAQAQDPYRAMLRGGLLPAVPAAVAAVVLAVVLAGSRGAAGSVLAAVVVAASFASTLLAMSRAARAAPQLVMAVALGAYTTKIALLAVLLLALAGRSWLSGPAFGLTAIAVALVWTGGELWAFTRVRTLVVDPVVVLDKVDRS